MSARAVAVIRPVPISSQVERSFRSCPTASVGRLPTSEDTANFPEADFADITDGIPKPSQHIVRYRVRCIQEQSWLHIAQARQGCGIVKMALLDYDRDTP